MIELTTTRVPILVAALAAVFAIDAGQGGGASKVAYDKFGQSFLEAHCPKGSTAKDCSVDSMLERDYALFKIGALDVAYPIAFLEDKSKAEDFKAVATGLVDMQGKWIQWLASDPKVASDSAADIATLRAWVQSWKPAQLDDLQKAKDKNLLVALKAESEVTDASTRIDKRMHSSGELGLAPSSSKNARVILSPTRLDFVGWLGYSGLADDAVRGANWTDDAAQWTQFWSGWDLVVALEYAPWDGFDPEFKKSQPMAKVGPTVMVQHVVQQATTSLLRHCMPSVPEGHFEPALAMLMVIEVCGEINTIEGAGGVSSSGAKTRPYSKFVPGGSSRGGTLPGRSAQGLSTIVENQWRKGHGKDRFAEPLRSGQRAGAKLAAKEKGLDPIANFALKGEDNNSKHLVHAPFFGPAADAQEYPPPEFLVDYAEMFRAYKCGFFGWIQQHGDAAPEAARSKFRTLLRGLSSLGEKRTFDDVVTDVYGVPLSSADGKADSLEWRFLKFLEKGK
jgi:hypothetical protein